LPFERGEELVYQAEFNKGLLHGIDVGEFNFKATSEHISRADGTNDPVTLRLTGDVVSKGLFPRIAGFKFHQHVESLADVEPFTVLPNVIGVPTGAGSGVLPWNCAVTV